MLTSLICKYFWHSKHSHIAQAPLTKLKPKGVLVLSDFKKYFLAIILNRISDWKQHQGSNLWVQLEHDLSNSDLFPQIWIPQDFRSLSENTSPLTRSTFTIWDSLHKLHGWLYNSPMHLMGHSYFPPGCLDPQFCN